MSAACRASVAALFVSVVFGCSSSAHNPSCKTQSDCGSGLTCTASECLSAGECASTQASCTDNSTCASGSSCVANCCTTFAGCRSNNDCVTTATTPICNTVTNACAACGNNGDCLAGTICTATGACSQGCANDGNCATGQQCLTGANGKFCGAQGSTPTITLSPATGTFIRAGSAAGSAFPTHVTVTLSFTVTTSTAVTVTAADADVVIANGGVVTIPAGATSGEVQLSATAAHVSEQLTATLGASTATAAIRVLGAAELPTTLALTPASPTIAENGNQTFTLTTDLPVPPSTSVAVDYGASASLFTTAPASVAFTANAITQTFVAGAGTTSGTSTITATLGTLTATSTVTVAAVAVGACSPVNSPLVISMVFGDGGFTGTPPSPYLSDFVELHNRSTAPVTLNGLSVQYSAATSTATPSGVVPLSNITLAAGQFYLVAMCTGTQCGTTSTGGASINPDQTATGTGVNMSFSNGKVFLVNGTTGITLNPAPTAPATTPVAGSPSAASAPLVLDEVGYGTANYSEGAASAPTGTSTPDFRKNLGCTDTDNNANDWDNASPPAPRNLGSPAVTCLACGGTN